MGKIPRPKGKKSLNRKRLTVDSLLLRCGQASLGVSCHLTASPEVSKELRVQVEDFSRPAPGPHTRSQAVGMQISVASGSAQSRMIKQSRMTKCQGLCKSVPACSLGHSALHQTLWRHHHSEENGAQLLLCLLPALRKVCMAES